MYILCEPVVVCVVNSAVGFLLLLRCEPKPKALQVFGPFLIYHPIDTIMKGTRAARIDSTCFNQAI
jgi:hypothetical protein